jgi:hypothetical protein
MEVIDTYPETQIDDSDVILEKNCYDHFGNEVFAELDIIEVIFQKACNIHEKAIDKLFGQMGYKRDGYYYQPNGKIKVVYRQCLD